MRRKTIFAIILFIFIIALSPIIARLGFWRTVHVWKAPTTNFSSNRPLQLSVEEFHAFVDPFKLYREHRIVVTDGGYAYIVNVELNFFDEISSANVEWHKNDVTFSVPSWIMITIPKERVVSQIDS